jgi:hypothetical protein
MKEKIRHIKYSTIQIIPPLPFEEYSFPYLFISVSVYKYL